MEPADLMPITMTVQEARKELGELDVYSPIRNGPDNISGFIRNQRMTPAQAQAVLVLAWNDLLASTQFGWSRGASRERGE